VPICTKIVSFVFIIAYIVFTRLVTNERTDGRTTNTQHYACIQSILVEASKSAIVIFVSVQSRPGGDLMFSICPSVHSFVTSLVAAILCEIWAFSRIITLQQTYSKAVQYRSSTRYPIHYIYSTSTRDAKSSFTCLRRLYFNPLIATLKPHSNGPSYSDWYTGR